MTVKQIQDKYIAKFGDLRFDEGRHLYFLNGDNLPSVSSKIKEHYEEIDFTPMRRAIAIKEGVSPEEIQERWDNKRDMACEKGTNTHLFAENYTGIEEAETPHKRAVKNFLDNLPSYYEIAIREARMHSRLYQYAGTSDLILLDKRYDSLVIADYKTNEDLFKHYNKFMNTPFENLLVNNYSKYSLQLSYYQIMLEGLEIPVSNRAIIHLLPDESFKIYTTVDYTQHLKHIMSNAS